MARSPGKLTTIEAEDGRQIVLTFAICLRKLWQKLHSIAQNRDSHSLFSLPIAHFLLLRKHNRRVG